MVLSIKRLDDKAEIYAFLSADRLYAAYAICDLEPALFRQCDWYACTRNGKLAALCLCFKGLPPDRVFLMGAAEDLAPVLDDVLRASKAYFACRPEQMVVLRRFYSLTKTEVMLRMVLEPEEFAPCDGPVQRLARRHVHQLQDLYRCHGEVAFAPYQVDQGVFYGLERDGRLVATAGTHLVSRAYSLGIVGNVFTHPEYRGLGYASVCTSAVVEELLTQSLDIVLNVGQTNEPGARMYERLGFRVYCSFVESFGVRRDHSLKSIQRGSTVQ
jgi:GNAT superfamily N-acetyltransferase